MMSTPTWKRRPNCSQVLNKYNEWAIDQNILKNYDSELILNQLKQHDQFFVNIFQNKLKL